MEEQDTQIEESHRSNNLNIETAINIKSIQTDLFISKEEQLKNWMKCKGFFASHEVIRWGVDNYYNRADRTKRDLQQEGLISKLSDDEKAFRGFNCKDDVYRWGKL